MERRAQGRIYMGVGVWGGLASGYEITNIP